TLDLAQALRRLLPWPAAGRLDELVPERLEVPTGSHIRLVYPDDPSDRVVLAVKLQECFGLLTTPTVADGRVPVLMHLLSPAQRPLAITDDLASFWSNAYPGVRAENRGRYPRHPWPEDPLTAPPRRGTTRSGR
ncbi:MAG: ATP-dependent helicase C-terminal domain-containing protein, partial [Luteococcus japonicus]